MNLEVLLEAERRGILPEDKRALLSEARRRGLVDPAPAGGVSTNSEAVDELRQKLKAGLAGGINSATLGFADEASGVVNGILTAPGEGTFSEGYVSGRDAVRAEHERLRQEAPGPYNAGQIAGGISSAAIPVGVAGTAARGASLASRAARSSGAGAAVGGAYGFGEGQGIADRLAKAGTGAMIGGGVGMAAPVVGGAVQRIGDNRAARRAIREGAADAVPTEELRALGQSLYQQVDDAGVQISPQSFSKARSEILEHLRGQGLDELPGPGSLTPKSARVMQIADEMDKRMASTPTAALPLSSLDQLRRHAGNAARSADSADANVGAAAIGQIDDYVGQLGPDDIVSGDVQAVKELLPKARDVWARMSRSQIVDDAIESSEDYLSGGASGIRNGFRKILTNKNLSRGFSEGEKAAMRRVINGSLPERTLNLLGGGLGQLGQIGFGAATGGLGGGVAGLVAGAMSRKGSEALTRKRAEEVRGLIANGSLERLPVASDRTRAAIESMLRRSGAIAPQ